MGMIQKKCTDDPLAMEAAVVVNEVSPDYGIAKFIAQKAASDGDKAKAQEYFEKAVELTDDNSRKSEVYLSLAKTQVSSSKSAAISSARRALAFDPSNKEKK